MDARCSPRWALGNHPEDQVSHFFRRRHSPDARPGFRNQPPVRTESGHVPADYGFGCDDDEGVLPTGPDPPSNYTEDFIEEMPRLGRRCRRFRTVSCWRNARFSKTRLPRLRKRRSRALIQRRSRLNMAGSYTRSNDWKYCCNLLILRSARVLARDMESSKFNWRSRALEGSTDYPRRIGRSTPIPSAKSHKAGAGVPTGRTRRSS